jgi:lipoyl(octanoyl) transferase
MSKNLDVDLLGRIEYGRAWNLQKELVAARTEDPSLPATLLLLEHPHTYTLGRHGDENNLLFDERTREEKGIALYRVDRGGDITYHGPGQLVGYPILYLAEQYGRGIGRIRSYVSDLETVLIQTLATFDIKARLYDGFRGVWVEEAGDLRKIAAIGVYVNRRGISSHGFALNIHTDLAYFDGIVPCGIDDHGVTSMSALLGRHVTFEELIPVFIDLFAARFSLNIQEPEGFLYAHN